MSRNNILSLDTETTGLDFWHGARPFFVTFCNDDGINTYFEWRVNPLTREVIVDNKDINSIIKLIRSADKIVLQNSIFDYLALRFLDKRIIEVWDWSKIEDTLIAGHLLRSDLPHDLTSMCRYFLSYDIGQYEHELDDAVKKARLMVKSTKWRIAKDDNEDIPSAKGSLHKYDMWLPREVALRFDSEEFAVDGKYSKWKTILADYANIDSLCTLKLWDVQYDLIKHKKLEDIYRFRMQLLPIIVSMKLNGVSLCNKRLDELIEEYSEYSSDANAVLLNIAEEFDYDLKLPKGSINNSLSTFIDSYLVPTNIERSTKTGKIVLNKACLSKYAEQAEPGSMLKVFLDTLISKRMRDTALQYMKGYKRFYKKVLTDNDNSANSDDYILHPNINLTGTSTLRCTSNNPNEQNISKKEGFNLRYCFGPANKREWYSFDAKNLELRIPAYEAGEKEMIDLFERPNDPPYFGSNHLLVCHILHPEKFEECIKDGVSFKDRYKSTLYQWVKNGNFAVQYGALEASGTADRAYKVRGGQRLVQNRFKNIKKLNDYYIEFANKHGYVETIPDKSICQERGYPLYCQRSDYGKIIPTIPLNYHIQGTAMWWTLRCMVECQKKIDEWREIDGFTGFITMQVHDELVFDFPKSNTEITKEKILNSFEEIRKNTYVKHKDDNIWRIFELKHIMESIGSYIDIPIPVGIEYHSHNWSKGIELF